MPGTPIPTLREALEFTRQNHWWVNVEIKDASGTPADAIIVERVLALIRDLGMDEQVLVSSFNHAYLLQAKSLRPQIATGALVEEAVPDPLALLRQHHAQAYHPPQNAVAAAQVQALRQAGFAVNVWTVNDEPEMRALIETGVSGIFTDFPQRLKSWME